MGNENSTLTNAGIKNIEIRKQAYEVADQSSPGLRLRINPTGKKSWFYRYRDPVTGKLVKQSIGVYPEVTLGKARAEWSALAAVRNSGVSPKAAKEAEEAARAAELAESLSEADKDRYTVAALAAAYVSYVSDRKKSWQVDQRILDRELLPRYGDMPAYDLTRGDIRNVLSTIRDRGADVMANRTLAAIRSMFNWALEQDWPTAKEPLAFNPCTGIKLTKEAPRQRALNDSELKTVLTNLPESGMPGEYIDLLKFVLYTGCRIGEACSMEREDLFGEEWRIPGTKSKNKQAHLIYLSPPALEILSERMAREPGQWIWSNPNTESGHIRPDTVGMVLRKAMPGLKVEPFRPHDLRRTLASWLGDQQVDEAVHDRVLNHVTGGIRKVYNTARYNEPARKWWNAWAQHIEGLESDNVVQLKPRKNG